MCRKTGEKRKRLGIMDGRVITEIAKDNFFKRVLWKNRKDRGACIIPCRDYQ